MSTQIRKRFGARIRELRLEKKMFQALRLLKKSPAWKSSRCLPKGWTYRSEKYSGTYESGSVKVIYFGDQFFVFQRLSSDESLDGITEQIRVFAIVESEAHLIAVGLQVLCADFVPCADDSPLQERERGLNRVSVDFPDSVVTLTMIDGAVLGIQFPKCFVVGGKVIRNDHVHVSAHVFFDVLRQCTALNIVSMEEAQSAVTLPDADDNLLRGSTSALAAFWWFATNISLINFHCTCHGLRIGVLH